MIKFSFSTCIALLMMTIQVQGQQPDQVIEFFRHGARGPISSYDPQWSESELGKLTVTGMVEHYDLGKKIAEKYPHLIASGYNPKDIYALSNHAERTLESAVVHVSSIFRGKTSTVTQNLPRGMQASLIAEYGSSLPASESSRGNYVPVHVNVVADGSFEELIFNGEEFCKVLGPLVDDNSASTQMKDGWTAFQPAVQEANSYLSQSQKITSMNKLYFAYDSFNCDMADGKTLPGGITDTDLIESLSYGQEYYMYVATRLQTLQRQLASWPVLKAIKDQLVSFRQGENAKKLVLFSGHDNNIRAALTALDVVNPDCLLDNYEKHKNGQPISYPNCHHAHFASNLIFEFYNQTTNPYVKVYFNDVIVPLCNGQESCSYEDLLTLFDKASGGIDSLDTWNQQCGNDSGLSTGAKIGIGIGSAIALATIVGITIWIVKKKKILAKIKHIKPIQNTKEEPRTRDGESESGAEISIPMNNENNNLNIVS